MSTPLKSQSNRNTVSNSIVLEAILNDRQLRHLHSKRIEIYTMSVPQVIIKDGKTETIWLDETNHPLLPNINKMIELREEQIKQYYSNQNNIELYYNK